MQFLSLPSGTIQWHDCAGFLHVQSHVQFLFGIKQPKKIREGKRGEADYQLPGAETIVVSFLYWNHPHMDKMLLRLCSGFQVSEAAH